MKAQRLTLRLLLPIIVAGVLVGWRWYRISQENARAAAIDVFLDDWEQSLDRLAASLKALEREASAPSRKQFYEDLKRQRDLFAEVEEKTADASGEQVERLQSLLNRTQAQQDRAKEQLKKLRGESPQ